MGKVQWLKRTVILGCMVGLLLNTAAGCGGANSDASVKKAGTQVKNGVIKEAASAARSVDITYWTVFTGPDGKFMQKLIEDYNEMNRGKTAVKMKVYSAVEYYNRIVPAAASGTAPDVAVMHINRVPEFAAKDILVPLDDFVDRMGYSERDFAPSVWKAGLMEGKRYAIPLDIHPMGLYYNVDMLKKAGFHKPPETLEEFVKIAEACTKDLNGDGTPDQWGYALTKGMNANIFLALLHQFGGRFVSDDGKTPEFNSPAGEQALGFLKDLIYKYKVCPANLPPDDDVVLFKYNKLALYMNGSWMITEFRGQKDLNFEVAPVPRFGNRKGIWADSHNLIMFKQRKTDPDKTAAADQLVGYLLKHSLEWAKAGQVPARTEVRNSREFMAMKDQYVFAQQESCIIFPAPTVYYDAMWNPLDEQVKNVLSGISKPGEALEAAAQKARENVYTRK